MRPRSCRWIPRSVRSSIWPVSPRIRRRDGRERLHRTPFAFRAGGDTHSRVRYDEAFPWRTPDRSSDSQIHGIAHVVLDLLDARHDFRGDDHCLTLLLGLDDAPEMHHAILDQDVRVGG